MASKFYSEYVSHMFRTYFWMQKNTVPVSKKENEVVVLNNKCCKSTLDLLSPRDADVIIHIFSQRPGNVVTVPEAVAYTASKFDVAVPVVWKILEDVTSLVAKQRGLV